MDSRIYYSHRREDNPNPDSWRILQDHLFDVAQKAADFASIFQAAQYGYLAGLWHDLGKYQAAFQESLLKGERPLNHSAFGAILAKKTFNDDTRALPMGFVIAGHHTGLANLRKSDNSPVPSLVDQLKGNQNHYAGLLSRIPEDLLQQQFPELPDYLQTRPGLDAGTLMGIRRSLEFWTRFLYSTLVDADYLDREAFLADQTKATLPRPAIPELRSRLSVYLVGLTHGPPVDGINARIDQSQPELLSACREASALPPGIFVLTTPSGEDNTLASLAFAMDHAEAHGLRRAIMVMPHTGLAEQTARLCGEAFGPENILEHHADFDPLDGPGRNLDERSLSRDLATENWDFPVIVTNAVLFFEALFSRSPYRCRKLHNIAGSVIILDQVQSLPTKTLICVTEALNELAHHYRCSVLISTPSPSALTARPAFPQGLNGARLIVTDSARPMENMVRADYSWPDPDLPGPSWGELAEELAGHDQVLAVVHRRGDARLLARLLRERAGKESVRHLSALMCPAHQLEILDQVRTALSHGEPCRLVTTALVETGCDLDFPVVYRALGGLDSMASAGRLCSRSDRPKQGQVKVFLAPSRPPRGIQSEAFEVTRALLQAHDGQLDTYNPELFEAYFRTLYYNQELDDCSIQPLRQEFNFADVDRDFKLIEDGFTRTVVAPYGKAPELLKTITSNPPCRRVLRELQPYTVQTHERTFAQILEAGAILEITSGLFTLSPTFEYIYDQDFGLAVADDPRDRPDTLIG